MVQLLGKGKCMHKNSELEVGQRRQLRAGEEAQPDDASFIQLSSGVFHYLCWTRFTQATLSARLCYSWFCFPPEALYPAFQGCIHAFFSLASLPNLAFRYLHPLRQWSSKAWWSLG